MIGSKYMIFRDEDGLRRFDSASIEVPSLKDGELLVKISYTTICKSDLYTFQGKRKEKTPTILGHEIVGYIISFGPNFKPVDLRGNTLTKGDRITWAIYASNPESPFSKKGIPQKSEDLFKYGHEQITDTNNLHGGLSEYIILRKNTPIIRLKENLPDKIAALINCSISTVAASLRLAGDIQDRSVLVSGAGMLGIIACAMLKNSSVGKIIIIDKISERVKKALTFGADIGIEFSENGQELIDRVKNSLGEKNQIDIVLEYSGFPSAMESTLNVLGIGGTAVWVGATFPQQAISLNAEMIIRKLITIKGIHNYNANDLIEATNFIESAFDSFDFESLVQSEFCLEETTQAYEFALNENPFRVGIDLTKKTN